MMAIKCISAKSVDTVIWNEFETGTRFVRLEFNLSRIEF